MDEAAKVIGNIFSKIIDTTGPFGAGCIFTLSGIIIILFMFRKNLLTSPDERMFRKLESLYKDKEKGLLTEGKKKDERIQELHNKEEDLKSEIKMLKKENYNLQKKLEKQPLKQ